MLIHVECLFLYGCLLAGLVVVIELGAYIHGVLTLNGCLLSEYSYMATDMQVSVTMSLDHYMYMKGSTSHSNKATAEYTNCNLTNRL